MKFSHRWWVIVALLAAFAVTVSFLSAQTEGPSAVNAPSGAEAQSDSVEVQSSSDEPRQKQPTQPTLVPDRDTAADVETDHLYNELRSKFLDDRAKTIDWWLEATAIFLTFLAIIIPIIVLIGGIFSFKRFNEIKDEAQRYVEEIKARRDEANSLVKGADAFTGTDPDKASEVVEGVQRNPDSSPIDRSVAAALLLQRQNRIEEAIEKWNSIANVVEGTDNELVARACFSVGYLTSRKKSVEKSDLEIAIDAYDKALRLNPDLVEAYNNRGSAKFTLGQHKAAIADFNEAIARNPDYAQIYNNRGLAKGALGQYDAAIADYDAAIARNPDNAEHYTNRGAARAALSQYEAAFADYDKALRLNPDFAGAYNNRGSAKFTLGQHEAAIADFNEAITRNPDYAQAYYNRGNAKDALGQHEAAIADFNEAIARNPGLRRCLQ